jgi:hypothetical protein
MGGARRSREGTVNAAKGLDDPDRRRGSTQPDMKSHHSTNDFSRKALRVPQGFS